MPRGSNHQRPYAGEFRREAVQLYRRSGRPLKEIADDLGVSSESLRVCRRPSGSCLRRRGDLLAVSLRRRGELIGGCCRPVEHAQPGPAHTSDAKRLRCLLALFGSARARANREGLGAQARGRLLTRPCAVSG